MRSARKPLFVAVIAALLLTGAFPPWNLWPLSWVALAPLYVVAYAADVRPIRAFWFAWVFGVVLFLAGAYWMLALGSVPWVMLAFIEAIPFGLQAIYCTLVAPRLPRGLRPVLFAAVWVMGEWMRGWGRVAFPWFLLASAQVRGPLPMLGLLTLTGQWGLSFAVALTSALLGEAFLSSRDNSSRDSVTPPRRQLLTGVARALAVPVVVFAIGFPIYQSRLASPAPSDADGETITVAAIQGNITKEAIEGETSETFRSNTMETYGTLTVEAAHGIDRPDLIVWPETVEPGKLLLEPDLLSETTDIARAAGTSLLVGTIDVDGRNQLHNSALLFNESGHFIDRYDKLQIVPIGEYFPLRDILGPIYKQYGVPDQDLEAGDRPGLLRIPYVTKAKTVSIANVGAMICYDDVFTMQARNRVRLGAEVLTLMTSDETFGTTAGPQQHADLDVLRAVETDRYMVRAAATGPSEVVTPTGQIQSLLPLDRKGIMQRMVPLRHGETFFVRGGDWFAWLCTILSGLLGLYAAFTRRTTLREASHDATAESVSIDHSPISSRSKSSGDAEICG